MQTNFDFLAQTDRFKDFAKQAAEAERSIAISRQRQQFCQDEP